MGDFLSYDPKRDLGAVDPATATWEFTFRAEATRKSLEGTKQSLERLPVPEEKKEIVKGWAEDLSCLVQTLGDSIEATKARDFERARSLKKEYIAGIFLLQKRIFTDNEKFWSDFAAELSELSSECDQIRRGIIELKEGLVP